MLNMDRLNRGIIKVNGEDSLNYLQALITNDAKKIANNESCYSLILTPQGKYLFDFFLYKINQEEYLIDCNLDRVLELISKLELYKLRSKVSITNLSNELMVVFGEEKEGYVFKDPRSENMGFRSIVKNDDRPVFEDNYHAHRMNLKTIIPEGELDLEQNKSFPLEWGLELLNAISFDKGCYVGQEVIARTKYRGVVRKQPMKVTAAVDLPAKDTEIYAGESKIGVMASSFGKVGIALIRVEDYLENKNNEFKAGDIKVIL